MAPVSRPALAYAPSSAPPIDLDTVDSLRDFDAPARERLRRTGEPPR